MKELTTSRFTVLVTPSEKPVLQAAAKADGRTLSDWSRRNLLAMARKPKGTKPGTEPTVRPVFDD